MKNVGLKGKMFLVALVPMILLTIQAIVIGYSNFSTFNEIEKIKGKMQVIDAASEMAHYTQIERGKSASYLGGGIDVGPLKDHWDKNNKFIEKFRKSLNSSDYDQKTKESLNEKLDAISSYRRGVESKEMKLGTVLKNYTNVIQSLLNMQLELSNSISIASASTSLRSIRILEESKESGGKLRANMSSIFAKDKPINTKKYKVINKFYSGLVEGLQSNGLSINEKNSKKLENLFKDKSWQSVNSSFYLILQNYKEGNYYQDSTKFFGIISGVLGSVNEVIISEKSELVKHLNELSLNAQRVFWLTVFGFTFLIVGLCYMTNRIAKKTSNDIKNVADILYENASEVAFTSSNISSSSTQLSEAATESASSLQETVSSIDEISSMIQRNADAASSSTHVSSKSSEAASRGKKTVEHMISSINDISDSNNLIAKEMQQNNEDISKIVEVISEIGEKTKVINDIVFQTKLLSFNASVEAARAGEHGKGFAVVAEEVGNLASMSGKAALEITEMLDSSIKQVTGIVDNTKKKVEALVESSKEKVETGTKTAHECGDALDEILQNVNSVNEMVREIATASNEQSTGVQEVTRAMQQLDQTTHQNTMVAQESSSMASKLKAQADGLNSAVQELLGVVSGDSSNTTFKVKETPSQASFEGYHNDEKVVQIETAKKKEVQHKPQGLKVAGLDTEIPDESDDRFEDL